MNHESKLSITEVGFEMFIEDHFLNYQMRLLKDRIEEQDEAISSLKTASSTSLLLTDAGTAGCSFTRRTTVGGVATEKEGTSAL